LRFKNEAFAGDDICLGFQVPLDIKEAKVFHQILQSGEHSVFVDFFGIMTRLGCEYMQKLFEKVKDLVSCFDVSRNNDQVAAEEDLLGCRLHFRFSRLFELDLKRQLQHFKTSVEVVCREQ